MVGIVYWFVCRRGPRAAGSWAPGRPDSPAD